MVDFFDKLYFIENKNEILERFRYYSILRFSIRLLSNLMIPIYFLSTQNNKKHRLDNGIAGKPRTIISLTSFPARINKLWLVVESLLRQETKPDMIILWLSRDQFSDLQLLPQRLLKLKKRGLEIRLCEDDLRSHKKYYYAMQEFPEDCVVSVDDDVFYNSKMLSYLIDLNNKHPTAICCNHAAYITGNNNEMAPYEKWQRVYGHQDPCNKIMPVGVGGVFYPPHSLNEKVFDSNVFKSCCFFADDIWLNVMARINHTKVAKTEYQSHYLPVLHYKNITLHSRNVSERLNDEQLNATRNYYRYNEGIDPYGDILNT